MLDRGRRIANAAHHPLLVVAYARGPVAGRGLGHRPSAAPCARVAMLKDLHREERPMPTTTQYGIAPPEFRLPPATHVRAVRLQVADLVRSLAWYQRVLGFEVRARDERSASLGVPGSARGPHRAS